MMPEPDKFLVCEKRCAECLFTPATLVSAERKKELLTACHRRPGAYFVCHRGQLTGNNQLCCRGFYDEYPDALVIVLAEMIGMVKFVPVPEP